MISKEAKYTVQIQISVLCNMLMQTTVHDLNVLILKFLIFARFCSPRTLKVSNDKIGLFFSVRLFYAVFDPVVTNQRRKLEIEIMY